MKFLRRDPRDGWYEIGPKDAIDLLANSRNNRTLSEWRAQHLCGQILEGHWRENGETVIFDAKGRLLDGQHRLRGIILANRAIVTLCVFGVPEIFFATMDQGANRSGAHLAGIMHFENASVVAGVGRLAIWREENKLGKTGKGKLDSETLRLYLKQHAVALAESVGRAVKLRGLIRLVPMSQAAFLHYMTRQHPRAMEFLDQLANGTNLHKGDAVLVFRHRMLATAGARHTLHHGSDEPLALLIKAWNSFLVRKPLTLIRWTTDEAFPTIDGAE